MNRKTYLSYISKRGLQLQRMMNGLPHYYNLITGRQQKNGVKGIRLAERFLSKI
jgi:uncharacterized short protein YbdD (DUF466 family)